MKPGLDDCKSYIECQFRDAGEKPVGSDQLFITISRQTGAGGITIGRKLRDYLKVHDKKASCGCPWEVYDKNLVQQVLKDHDLSEKLADFMPEDRVSEIDDIIDELLGLHPATWTLVRKTSETIIRLASLGKVILVGRGANVITRKLPGGFHVRLVGSLDKRIKHVQEYYGHKRKQSEAFVKAEDEGRKRYLKKNCGKNIDDPLLYDLVINTDNVSYDEAARIIGHASLQRAE